MGKKKKNNQISSILFYKRINEISQIKEAFDSNKKIKSTNLSKVGYILWQYPETRNSDITLALKFYKVFYPELIKQEAISFENFYKLPKMYDIQRDRAKIQNDYKLFPASAEVQRKRHDRSEEYTKYYLKDKAEELCATAEYSLFFDESGKEEQYFILAGIVIDSLAIELSEYQKQILAIKSNLLQKFGLTNEELKFTNIKQANYEFYKEFIDELFKLQNKPMFCSILINNQGLKKHSKLVKTEKLLEFMLMEALSPVIQKATRNSLLNSVVNLNITLDIDGKSPDMIETKEKENNLQNRLNERYKYFVNIDNLQWEDSKNNIFIQLSDLYASSLNNIFSDKPTESRTAKAKKDFAWFILSKVGIKNIDDNDEENFIFYNKALVKFENTFNKDVD